MKKFALLLVAIVSLLAGCVVAPAHGGYGGDRDRDGVPNKADSRPNNPNKY